MKITKKQIKTKNIKKTKKRIINTARCLFSEFSYLDVSMNDIAKKLNITKAALYYHFSSKSEIYKEVINQTFNDLILSIKTSLDRITTEEKLHRLVKNYLDFGSKEKNLIKVLILKLPPTDIQIKKYIIQSNKQIINLIQSVIDEMLLNKKLSLKINSKRLSSFLVSIMNGLLLEYSFLNKKINSRKLSNQIIVILFKRLN
jgi:AcrR family transcriptional regulator